MRISKTNWCIRHILQPVLGGCVGKLVQPRKITLYNASKPIKHNIKVVFHSHINESSPPNPLDLAWEAQLFVFAWDFAQLMEEGFKISPDNEMQGRGCVLPDKCPPDLREHGWNHTRRYILRDHHGRWHAHLIVAAREIEAIAGFQLEKDLADERVASCKAWNRDYLWVYNYDAYNTRENFNAVLEGRPVERWWPSWTFNRPRKASDEQEGEGAAAKNMASNVRTQEVIAEEGWEVVDESDSMVVLVQAGG